MAKKKEVMVAIVIKASRMTCPIAGKMIEQAKQGPIQLPILVQQNQVNKQWEAYAEDCLPDNKIGLVVSVDGDADTSKIEPLLKGDYQLRIVSMHGANLLDAELRPDTSATAASSSKSSSATLPESKELKEAWKEKIEAGIVTEEDRTFVTAIFDNNKVDPVSRLRAVQGYRKYYLNGEEVPITRPSHPYVNADPENKESPYDGSIFAECLRQALDRNPTNYVGDKSVGKNVCGKTVAYVLHMPYWEDTMSEDTMKSDLIAERSISDEAQKHMTRELLAAYDDYRRGKNDPETVKKAREYQYWRDQAGTMQLQTELGEMGKWALCGGLYMLNEKNLGRINTVESVVNPAAEDNQPHLTVTGYGLVYLNPDCVLCASENMNYAGTNGSNDAVDSRFGMIMFPYPPHIFDQLKSMTEADLGAGCLKDSYYAACDKLYVFLRDQVHTGNRSNGTLSLRSFGRALKSVVRGKGYATLHSQLLIALQSLCKTDDERAAIREDINAFIGNI